MGSLPKAKAGVGSAVNDTTRELGGAFGVAIIGSTLSSLYAARLGDTLDGTVPAPALERGQAVDGMRPSRSAIRSAGATVPASSTPPATRSSTQ